MQLTNEQREAVDKIHDFVQDSSKHFFMLAGFAGTGKSTAIQTFARETHAEVALCAPTNKAVRVLKDMARKIGTANVTTVTIHSLLGLRPNKAGAAMEFTPEGENNAESYDVVVVDEASMVSTSLFELIKDTSYTTMTKFIFMGDPLQLPPINEAMSPTFGIQDRATLSQVLRHDNQILRLTTHIRAVLSGEGTLKLESDNDDHGGVFKVNWKVLRKQMAKGYASESYDLRPDAFKTLAWTNKTVQAYNDIIREAIYGRDVPEVFQPHERVVACAPVIDLHHRKATGVAKPLLITDEEANVIQIEDCQHPIYRNLLCHKLFLRNDFDAEFKEAYVVHAESKHEYESMLRRMADDAKARRGSWGAFWDAKESFHDIRPCHAVTTHRSQGSTFETAFVDASDILKNPNKQEALQCLYVAVSRASKNVVIQV